MLGEERQAGGGHGGVGRLAAGQGASTSWEVGELSKTRAGEYSAVDELCSGRFGSSRHPSSESQEAFLEEKPKNCASAALA